MAQRVLLIYPPFGAMSFPSVGLSILKSVLIRAGIACDIRYLNLEFIDRLPGGPSERVRRFDTISQRSYLGFGDWIFTEALFGAGVTAPMDEGFRRLLAEREGQPDLAAQLLAARAVAQPFLDDIMERTPWREYGIVGFHSIFNQTIAALAIARRLKEAHPLTVTLLGGPAVQDEIGAELLRRFPQIDYVVQGEADRTIVPIVQELSKQGTVVSIPGVMYRRPRADRAGTSGESGEVVCNPIDTVADMDTIPVPDFDDYFATLRGREFEQEIDVFLPIENARGCWWGAKHHCVFCGMVGQTMAFRSKSPDRVLDDIRQVVSRYGVRTLICVDSILDMRYFDTLLPRLAEARLDIVMFHEVKANLTRSQVHLLDDAGIHLLQPGLEHLSTKVLVLMRKGTSYLQNVQFLKWARERNMIVFWSILYGFPGETWADYAALSDRIRSLYHLFPPKTLVRVRADRFSPLHFAAEELGLSRVYPAAGYYHLYPFDQESVRRLAYHFEYDYADRDPGLNQRIDSELAGPICEWNDRYFGRRATLSFFEGAEQLLLLDTRYDHPVYYVMHGTMRRIYLECDTARSCDHLKTVFAKWRHEDNPPPSDPLPDSREQAIVSRLEAALGAGVPVVNYPQPESEAELVGLLDRLLADGLATSEGNRYLALACRASAPPLLTQPPSWGSEEEAMASLARSRNVRFEGVEGLFAEPPLVTGSSAEAT